MNKNFKNSIKKVALSTTVLAGAALFSSALNSASAENTNPNQWWPVPTEETSPIYQGYAEYRKEMYSPKPDSPTQFGSSAIKDSDDVIHIISPVHSAWISYKWTLFQNGDLLFSRKLSSPTYLENLPWLKHTANIKRVAVSNIFFDNCNKDKSVVLEKLGLSEKNVEVLVY